MLIVKDIHALDLHETRIRDVFNRYGTKAARKYIYSRFMLKLTGKEVRSFLKVPGYNHRFAIEVKELAWQVCGWPGNKAAKKWNAVNGGLEVGGKL